MPPCPGSTLSKAGSQNSLRWLILTSSILGYSGSDAKTFGKTRIDPHNWRSAFFAQDDIKLTPELTLNFGVRYDYFTEPDNNLPYPSINPLTALSDPITTVYKVNSDTNNI